MRLRQGKAHEWIVFAVNRGGELEHWDSFTTEAAALRAWKSTYKSTLDIGRFVLCRASYEVARKAKR